ncbi:hypothetical protein [Kibdelosporangium phytohabitans]|uniref:Uncharacterized protein n=2 Tax=Kibdelosporangium phytohabitans TaxID=860235 RepID=A0A0N9I439_9PSEU|nr:hypothetical protein [Kibdelosporangium phytohabitans]ALG09562.1 hypothetical protein AOZ06_24030 [Kibdelosporangium phytohabitans]
MAALLAAVGVVVGISGIGSSDVQSADVSRPTGDPADRLRGLAADLSEDASYRPPTSAERKQAIAGLTGLIDGQLPRATQDLMPLGFTVSDGTDPVTNRRYTLVVNEPDSDRAWGVYLIDTSAPLSLVVEVPHPNFDLGTERIGVDLFRQVPGSVLLMSGTHRRAEDGAGDVAHRNDSLFHALAVELGSRDIPQVQLHGFHDKTLEGTDIVISPGAGEPNPLVRETADNLANAGLAVCRAWSKDCGKLEGTRNQQGRNAAENGTVFLHVEINRTVRDDNAMSSRLVRAIADAMKK